METLDRKNIEKLRKYILEKQHYSGSKKMVFLLGYISDNENTVAITRHRLTHEYLKYEYGDYSKVKNATRSVDLDVKELIREKLISFNKNEKDFYVAKIETQMYLYRGYENYGKKDIEHFFYEKVFNSMKELLEFKRTTEKSLLSDYRSYVSDWIRVL